MAVYSSFSSFLSLFRIFPLFYIILLSMSWSATFWNQWFITYSWTFIRFAFIILGTGMDNPLVVDCNPITCFATGMISILRARNGLELNQAFSGTSCFSDWRIWSLICGNVRWARQTCSIVSSGVSPELLLHLQVSQLGLSISEWWWLRHQALPRVGRGFCLDLISVAILHDSVMIQPRYRENRT